MKNKEMHLKALAEMIHAMGKETIKPFKEKASMHKENEEHGETEVELEHPKVKSPIEKVMEENEHEPLETEEGPAPNQEETESKMFKPSWMKKR